MRIIQIYNNSVVSARRTDGSEVVVMGKGIGFDKKVGDLLPPERIEKVFTLEAEQQDLFKQLLQDVSFEHLHLSNEIIGLAKQRTGKRLNDNIYITLTDHISYAIERHKQNIHITNALLWEIKQFYQLEYLSGMDAVALIKQNLGIDLGEDEAGFIALHIVNAELDTSMENMKDLTALIKNIVQIVKFNFKQSYDEDSLDYNRFVTHLRYLGQRIFSKKKITYDDPMLSEMMASQFPKAYACAEKIALFVKKEYNYSLSNDELVFLAVHIRRLTAAAGADE